ncbi:hypothetical protein EC973_005210 [Apophysomyces ossiformis]|uniref:Zn(2)-C6 fungal-type domain-containing protein n=1 Tax=Apophysomyces ossiformis TaxID=679940 RepID=A0A8H7C0T4_9FUNG|nr:hypothetical protein EC973_005210 [Apophysomyces ossiformis]
MADALKESSNNNNLGAACFRCRGFRHACDRQKPSCSRCQRRGIACTYPSAAPTLKKLQKATETLGDRIKKFGDRLKAGEGMPRDLKGISLQRLAQRSTTPDTPPSIASDNRSSISIASDTTSERDDDRTRSSVASTRSFSVYPCSKCYKDLQQCDLTLPQCSRCASNSFQCVYTKTEPKANHVSQVLNTMNKVMDQWQESIDRMAKDFAQKTRDSFVKTNNAFKMKPLQPFAWKITSTGKGLSVESNVNSFNDLSKLVDQFKRSMHISPREPQPAAEELSSVPSSERERLAREVELDDTSSIHTSSGYSFAVWNSWSHPTHALPQDYPIDISPDLTDNLVDLYCRTACCSALRLPVIDTVEFLARYRDPDESKRPSTVLIYAVCAMAARNAFQLHVWSKRPAHESPQYNIGKALSMAYCLKGRELLADCFDQPSMDNCQAAILLSYCNHQNGYPGVIYIYEWISYSMAQELGLYDPDRDLTRQEKILVWCLYYFNTWYRVLQGDSSASVESSQFYPRCSLPPPLPKPDVDSMDLDGSDSRQMMIDYYVWNVWHYLIQLQILRHDVMSRLLTAQAAGKSDINLPLDLMAMQDKLQEFYESLPEEWKNPDLESIATDLSASSPDSSMSSHDHCRMNIRDLAVTCRLTFHVYYNINRILLYQAFFPSDHLPTNPFSLKCLETCMDAAYAITCTNDIMVRYRDECNAPLLGLLFANIVYVKLMNYNDEQYQTFAQQCLQRSIDVCKASKAYMYNFEMAQSFVKIMEQEVRSACSKGRMSTDSPSDAGSLPSPPSLI